jgi:hypothetical protein
MSLETRRNFSNRSILFLTLDVGLPDFGLSCARSEIGIGAASDLLRVYGGKVSPGDMLDSREDCLVF